MKPGQNSIQGNGQESNRNSEQPALSKPSVLLSPKIKTLLLIAITLLAAFLRFYRISTLPPGDGYDPAYYGVDALQILQGEFPIFLPTNIGREVLFSYLVALCVAVFGIGPHAIHIASAIVGVATVPAVYLVAEELFADEDNSLRQFGGLFAALMLAVSFWHLNWSRYGVRAITVPLLCALTLYFLLRALRTDSRRDFAFAGGLLGLSMYTYQSARALPLLVVLGFVYAAIGNKCWTRRDWGNALVVIITACIVFAPLGYYFLTHPGSGLERVNQVLIFDTNASLSDNWTKLKYEIVDAILVLTVHGDEEPIHNLPGRPAMNPFLSVLFVVGLAISLGRIRKPRYALILTWIPVMSVTVILSLGGQPTKRMLGALPAFAALIAIGALVPYEAARRWVRRRGLWATGVSLTLLGGIVVGFAGSAALTYRDYFLVWGRDPNLLFTHFEAGRAAIGQYAATLPSDEQIYISPELPQHPSVVYNSGGRPGMKGYNGRVCVVIPEHTTQNTTYIIVPNDDKNSLDLLNAYFPTGEIVAEGPLHYQQPYFLAFRVPKGSSATIRPSHYVTANWDHKIGFLGYDLDAETYKPGETITLILYYQALADMDANYIVFTHLLGPPNPASEGGPLWGQDDSEPCRTFYPTSIWEVGEIVRDEYQITIPDTTPPGTFDLQMGFYTWPDIQHLYALDEHGEPTLMTFVFGQVVITSPEG